MNMGLFRLPLEESHRIQVHFSPCGIGWGEVSNMRLITRPPVAIAKISGNRDHSGLTGTVRFYQFTGGILVEAEVTGLPNHGVGFYGFHIHTGGSCGGADFASTGGHLNPSDTVHPRHAGDLPPLLSYNGRAYMAVMTDRFSLPEILGRTVVIHQKPDDFRSQPAGDSGDKIACGLIQRPGKM